ncbi:MAG: hypothetical protein EZS28_027180 [Streblomastix strix]|uniref:Uncharacterized protein n=1 Tax=Streblomastix strix TaxID=222440 RepID=A0A5J4V4M6_9EUKA|nr:MAG: hypothetical protein EZS28_027180 [Streblomastix strix]
MARLAAYIPAAESIPIGIIPALIHGLIQTHPTRAHAAHLAALVTRYVQGGVRELINRYEISFPRLSSVVKEGKDDESGNAAVALAECAKEKDSLNKMRETGCLEALVQCMQTRTGHTQRNAAIALARASQDPINLQRVRALHGIELMHKVKTDGGQGQTQTPSFPSSPQQSPQQSSSSSVSPTKTS